MKTRLELLIDMMMTVLIAQYYQYCHGICPGLASNATYKHQLMGLLHQAVLDYRDTPEGSTTISGPISTEVADIGSLYIAEVRLVFRVSCRVQGAALTRWAYAAQGATISCGT